MPSILSTKREEKELKEDKTKAISKRYRRSRMKQRS